jgi:hypothetical protein
MLKKIGQECKKRCVDNCFAALSNCWAPSFTFTISAYLKGAARKTLAGFSAGVFGDEQCLIEVGQYL